MKTIRGHQRVSRRPRHRDACRRPRRPGRRRHRREREGRRDRVEACPARPPAVSDDGHRAGLGLRGRQRDHRALSRRRARAQRRRRAPRSRPRSRRQRGRRCRSWCRRSRRRSRRPTRRRCGRCPTAARRPRASRWASRRRRRSCALCADDGAARRTRIARSRRAGVYVPTVVPAVAALGQAHAVADDERVDQFRPGPPPALTSEVWARDYNEIKALGGKNSTQRTPEQTAIATFWEATAPADLLAGRALGRDHARARGHARTRACSRWPRWPWTTR